MPPPPLVPTITVLSNAVALLTTAKPDIELRQNTAQSNDEVTLSITRDYTTYTTIIILAGTVPPQPSNTPMATVASTAVEASNTPTTAAPAAQGNGKAPPGAPSSDPRSDVIIGAIVGTILGAFTLIFLVWCCFFRRRRIIARVGSSSGSGSSSSSSERPAPRRVRIEEVRQVRVQDVRQTTTASRGGRVGGIFGAYRRPQVDDG